MKVEIDGEEWELCERSCCYDKEGRFSFKARPLSKPKETIAARTSCLAIIDLLRGSSEVVPSHVAQAVEERIQELENRITKLEAKS